MKVLCSFLILLAGPSALAASYGAFGNYTLGSSRAMGLGGAYTAVSDDSNAFLFNPAGVTKSDSDFLFDASTNQLTNNELILNRGPNENVTKQHELIGVHFKKGRLSIGFGYMVPFFAEVKQWAFPSETIATLKIQEVGLNLSYELNKEWAVGINGKYSDSLQTETSSVLKNETRSQITYWQWGILYHKNRFAIGYSFMPERFWKKSNDLSTTFLDIAAPQKQILGISYFIKPDKIRLNIDMVNVGKLEDAVAFDDSLNRFREPINASEVTFPKVGLEFVLVETNKTNAQFRVGYYDEPSRFQSVLNRKHFTIGFEVRIGPALLQVAQDQAEGFNNTSQALGVVFDRL